MDENEASAEGVSASPIFHVHPSLRCNLACAHCYSHSSPSERDALAPELIEQAIADAAALGFGILSVSGGEPLMYEGLVPMLAHARALGMRTQIATNGWFLESPRLEQAAPLLDLLAISVDGPRELHNALRGSPRAFDRLVRGLASIRERGIEFGIVHTVTAANWEHLFATAAFAADSGARLLQLHMIEMAGRALTDAADLALDEDLVGKAYVLAALLKIKHSGAMHVHTDLLHRSQLPDLCDGADIVRALGIMALEADGTIVPLAYGFDRRFAVCNIREQSLASAWGDFAGRVFPHFLGLRLTLHDELGGPGGPDVFNWYELMVARSGAHDMAEPALAAFA
jgi:MoaA/NifB/PqqE/SkfB family radical SAM enzyme